MQNTPFDVVILSSIHFCLTPCKSALPAALVIVEFLFLLDLNKGTKLSLTIKVIFFCYYILIFCDYNNPLTVIYWKFRISSQKSGYKIIKVDLLFGFLLVLLAEIVFTCILLKENLIRFCEKLKFGQGIKILCNGISKR